MGTYKRGLALLFLILLGWIGWMWGQRVSPPDARGTRQHGSEQLSSLGIADCNVARQPCLVGDPPVALGLRLGPPVEALEPFTVDAVTELADSERPVSVEISFSMAGMDMGSNRYRLQPAGKDHWTGTAVLPICASGRVDWLATLSVRTDANHWQASFPFAMGGR